MGGKGLVVFFRYQAAEADGRLLLTGTRPGSLHLWWFRLVGLSPSNDAAMEVTTVTESPDDDTVIRSSTMQGSVIRPNLYGKFKTESRI